ncbi:DUF1624 domain-containing protein [Mucilaginibacter mali]|uniref:DUF1624 domain-containing protein n=1 Tax=Mucilaginibacter mali TaxID=2740462 RepID=A0A7D4Q781_9SPHI|nr:heparan-alpha-glucosaminide N-acetyltransferase domain-containing protein [Mucilaginibacter mali]QKJ32767.1 DUF1624 domain-containing protein [Mucilaginibacter mali]
MEAAIPQQTARIHAIDILRGIIMVIMALDHVRDFFSNSPVDPLDLEKASTLLFFTRWITHFCAPAFVFLSGASAFLSLSKKKTKKEASLFLLSRGIWLLVLELTIIGFGWQFDIGFHTIFAQVIWAIGWSMIILSALIFLKPVYVGVFGLILIFGHNAYDYVKADSWGEYKFFWMFLHETNFYKINDYESIFLLYPLVPWVGVMAAGYAFGTLFKLEPAERRKAFISIGISSLILFIAFRGFNVYGDPIPWQKQATLWRDVLAIIKCQKYPPSLAYLLMTLGISILALVAFDKTDNKLSRFFTVFGRVPLFYYVLHIYLVHSAEIFVAKLEHLSAKDFQTVGLGSLGPHGFGLVGVYLVWLAVIVILYFPCRWYMKYKQTHKQWWLSYL